jgi:hypothetical protein
LYFFKNPNLNFLKARSGNPGYITGLPKPQVPNSFLAPYMFKLKLFAKAATGG